MESASATREGLTRWQLVSIKKFMLNALGESLCPFQTAFCLHLMGLIFSGKLEMVLSSVSNVISDTTQK